MLLSMGTQTDLEKHISDSPAMAHSTIMIKKSDMSLSLSDHSKIKGLESNQTFVNKESLLDDM